MPAEKNNETEATEHRVVGPRDAAKPPGWETRYNRLWNQG